MQVEGLIEKTEQAQYRLMLLLQEQEKPLGIKEVVAQTGLSKVTLFKYIEALNDLFDDYQLDAYVSEDNHALYFYQGPELTKQELLQPFLASSVKYHILLYLFQKEHFTIQKLAQDLLISDATLNRHLASLNQLLAEFGLAIGQGYLLGAEHQRRYFYYDLFLQTWTKADLERQIGRYDSERAVILIERLCAVSLNDEKAYRLKLWFSITQQRLSAQRKDFKDLDILLRPYANHIFFQRLERAVLHYFSQFAVEFDRGEAGALFVFLSSQFILPIQTIEYILGFGGPISDLVTEGIGLLRQNGLIQGKTNEQVIYVLGQLVAQAYFFKGAFQTEPLGPAYQADLMTYLPPILQDVVGQLHEIVVKDKKPNDLAQRIYTDLVKFMIFLQEQGQTPLLVGLDMGDNQIEQSLLTLMLGQYLENNRLIHLQAYEATKTYDCVISQAVLGNYGQAKVYRLKHLFTPRELRDLSQFLKEALQMKNT